MDLNGTAHAPTSNPFAHGPIPRTPDKSFRSAGHQLSKIESWELESALSLVAALATIPELHTYSARIDWLQRLILSKAHGSHQVTTTDLHQVLTSDFFETTLSALEEPSPDPFCDKIPTSRGNFRIFPGLPAHSALNTQILIRALENNSAPIASEPTLSAVYSLLRLSDEIATRSRLDRQPVLDNKSAKNIPVPNLGDASSLVSRISFTDSDFGIMGIDVRQLDRFLLRLVDIPLIASQPVGNSALELHPLIRLNDILYVVSVVNISLAIRGSIIECSRKCESQFSYGVQKLQERYAALTGFWPDPRPTLSPTSDNGIRETSYQYDQGRFLQIMQVSNTHDNIDTIRFNEPYELSDSAEALLMMRIRRFWDMLEIREDVRSSTTVMLICGRGFPFAVRLNIKDSKPPSHWDIVWLSFVDAFILGHLDDGKLIDILRIREQRTALENHGFIFHYGGNLVDLYGHWRDNGFRLVPEDIHKSQEVSHLIIQSNHQRDLTFEVVTGRDEHALLHPQDGYKIVSRFNSRSKSLRNIYGCEEDARKGVLTGVYSRDGREWWISISDSSKGLPRDRFKIWETVLHWLDEVSPPIVSRHPGSFPQKKIRVKISVPVLAAKLPVAPSYETGAAIQNCIRIENTTDSHSVSVIVKANWTRYLMMPTNDAEVHLVAAVLYGLRDSARSRLSRCDMSTLVKSVIGTTDWRHIHGGVAIWPIERLLAKGLVAKYSPPSRTCDALVRSGSALEVVSSPIGTVFSNPSKCEELLVAYRDKLLKSLVGDLRRFSRRHVLSAFGTIYQAALGEQVRWRTSIRALRAIKGEKADRQAFAVQNDINLIRRSSKVICEIGACECGISGSMKIGREEIERLQSKCSLIINCSETLSGVRSGLFRPEVQIGSEGDLVIAKDRSLDLRSIGTGWLNAKILDDATIAYLRRRDPSIDDSVDNPDWYEGLCSAIEHEYHVPFDVYRDFASALCDIAERKQVSVFLIRQSRLLQLVRQIPRFRNEVTVKFLDRLILRRRRSWFDGLTKVDRDLSRLDRAKSLINHPIAEIEGGLDPLLLVVPALVSEACLYSVSSLIHGLSNQRLLLSKEARRFAGQRGMIEGIKFQERVAAQISGSLLQVEVGWTLSKILHRKVSHKFGDVDILVINHKDSLVWVIEVKNLRLCRTSYEIASRISEYRGEEVIDRQGKKRPDKLLRHMRRVEYLRRQAPTLMGRFELSEVPSVRGLLVFDSPQPVQSGGPEDWIRQEILLFGDVSSFPF